MFKKQCLSVNRTHLMHASLTANKLNPLIFFKESRSALAGTLVFTIKGTRDAPKRDLQIITLSLLEIKLAMMKKHYSSDLW